MYFSSRAQILGTGSCVPSREVTNEDLAEGAPVDPRWVHGQLGIRARRISAPDQLTSDLAFEASRRALESAGMTADRIDLIIVGTATPDRCAPSTACLLHGKLGAISAPAFDVSAVCSGFVYGLTVAAQFIETGAANAALVVGADTFSRITDWGHRDCAYFGDGAGAVVLGRSRRETATLNGIMRADGRKVDAFTVLPRAHHFTMDGHAVRETALNVLPTTVEELLRVTGTSVDEIACVVPHQPAVTLLRQVFERVGIDFRRVKTNMEMYGNTCGATVPLLLDEVRRRGEIACGDKILFVAIGSGMTWGAMLYTWH